MTAYGELTCLLPTHGTLSAVGAVVAAVPAPALRPGVQLAGAGLAAGVYLGTLPIGAAVALLPRLHKRVTAYRVCEEPRGRVVYAGAHPAAERGVQVLCGAGGEQEGGGTPDHCVHNTALHAKVIIATRYIMPVFR